MTHALAYPPPFQDIATLSEHICAGESTIEGWVKQGILPKPKKVGGKRLWRWKEVEERLALDSADMAASSNQADRIRDATRKALQGG